MKPNRIWKVGDARWHAVSTAALAFATLAYCCSVTVLRSSTKADQGRWKVTQHGSGLMLQYAWGAEQTTEPTVVYRDGSLTQSFPLESKRGALLFSPRTPQISIQVITAASASSPVHLFGEVGTKLEEPQPNESYPWLPVSIFRPGMPEVKTRAYATRTVAPALPIALRNQIGNRSMDVQVFFKISDGGLVTAVSTGRYSSPAQQQIAQIASEAALQWRFAPVKMDGKTLYADGQMQFRFLPSHL